MFIMERNVDFWKRKKNSIYHESDLFHQLSLFDWPTTNSALQPPQQLMGQVMGTKFKLTSLLKKCIDQINLYLYLLCFIKCMFCWELCFTHFWLLNFVQ